MEHARNTYPEECCGFLIGTDSGPRIVQRVLPAWNTARPSKLKRYNIDPTELLRASEEANRSNLELFGVYHSHPDAPVEPSVIDLEFAWPDFTYLVLSLQNGDPRDVGAWSLNQAHTAFEPDELRVV
jgi:proteasome lid subunit RPN8/RPN11